MQSADLLRQKPLWMALFVSGVLGLSGAVIAAGEAGQSTTPPAAGQTTSPAGTAAGKPVPPSKSETADSAFKKLAAGKSYVTMDDVKDLLGFDKVFEAADADHDGKLTAAEFKKAWSAYTASEKGTRG